MVEYHCYLIIAYLNYLEQEKRKRIKEYSSKKELAYSQQSKSMNYNIVTLGVDYRPSLICLRWIYCLGISILIICVEADPNIGHSQRWLRQHAVK